MSDFQRYWTSDVSGTESGPRNPRTNSTKVPPNYSNQRLKIFVKNFVHRTGIQSFCPWIPAGEIDMFAINFKFTRRKTIKCGCLIITKILPLLEPTGGSFWHLVICSWLPVKWILICMSSKWNNEIDKVLNSVLF